MATKTPYYSRLVKLLASRRFFWFIVVLLVVQALWIALSGRYPMAFDEDYHLGLIKLYAGHINPWWSAHPAGGEVYGALTRDPSYLYHWLMSFPYRFIRLFTADQTIQVICLRFIDIGLFATSLPLFRRLLLKTGASRAMAHFCLLIFVLLPVVSQLAAQINYDNLIIPITAAVLLLAVAVTQELREHKRLNARTLSYLIVLSLLGTLVKYAFLPVALAVAVYLAVRLWRTFGGLKPFWAAFLAAGRAVPRRTRWLLRLAILLSLLLFGQRYFVNLARYHTPVPDCDKVLSVDQCLSYGPWARDYRLVNSPTRPPDHTKPLIVFNGEWFYGMWLRSLFAVDGPATQFQTRGPLLLPGIGAIVFAALAIIATGIAWAKGLFRAYDTSVLALFGLVSGFYVVLLWLDEYKAFLHTGQPVAINGRYLFPILPMLLVIGVLALSRLLAPHKALKTVLASVLVICLIWGGGVLTFALRSNDTWYWPSTPLKGANHAIQDGLGPIIPGYRTPTQFLSHN